MKTTTSESAVRAFAMILAILLAFAGGTAAQEEMPRGEEPDGTAAQEEMPGGEEPAWWRWEPDGTAAQEEMPGGEESGEIVERGSQNCGSRLPNNFSVRFFVDNSYRGRCFTVESIGNVGAHKAPNGYYRFNDNISSVLVGQEVKVFACRDRYYGGRCEWIRGHDGNLSNNYIGTDKISSFQVMGVDVPATCMVTGYGAAVFVGKNFGGSCRKLGLSYYRTAQNIGLPQDSISSIRVGHNFQVCVYRNTGFGGRKELISRDDPDLSNNAIGDNTISSLVVQRRGAPCT